MINAFEMTGSKGREAITKLEYEGSDIPIRKACS